MSSAAETEAERYDAAEQAYLLAVQSGESDRRLLVGLASAVRDAARALEKAAYKEFFSARDQRHVTGQELIELEIAAEKGEVLAELWEDLLQAHSGRYRLPNPQ
jgi:hypothetical protein